MEEKKKRSSEKTTRGSLSANESEVRSFARKIILSAARRERRGGRDRAQIATTLRWILIKTVIRKKRRAGGAFTWKIMLGSPRRLPPPRFVVVPHTRNDRGPICNAFHEVKDSDECQS